MPTYIVRAAEGLLAERSKAQLAQLITRIHAEVTGDRPVFVQTVFRHIEPGDCYIGGRPLSSAHCFIQGHIREGWSAIIRAELIEKILPVAWETLGLPRYAVWMYLSELPARAMSEFGHILPGPGAEDTWFDSLPEEDRKRLEAI